MVISYIKNMITDSTTNLSTISLKELRRAGRVFPSAFQFTLKNNPSLLRCVKVVRVIPGKRIVAFGEWEEKPIVAKIFFDRKAEQHLHQDVEGVDVLQRSGIPTPKLLFQGTALDKRIHIIIFERIFHSRNLEEMWQERKNLEDVSQLLRYITIELATQHVLGVVQRDLHLKNFLFTRKKLYTLDGGSIDYQEEILPKKQSLEHLALFFTQLGAGTEKLQQDLLDVYAKSRGWNLKPADRELVSKAVINLSKERWQRYQKKIFRNCTAFGTLKKTRNFIMYDRDYETPEFEQVLRNPDAIFGDNNTEILKSGRSATVAKIKINDKTLVIKRYNVKGFLHWLRRCLRESRAANSWRLGHCLRLFEIKTSKPIAFIENRFLGLRSKSYLIMEYIDGSHIGEYFSQNRSDETKVTKMAERVVVLLKNLLSLRMTHGDLKMTNILIENDTPVLIDLDGMTEHKSYFGLKRAWHQEVKRFMRNWENLPSVRTIFERMLK